MIRLFCVPYAGGSALVYKPWIADFQRQGIELIPLEMKGRGSRITESFYADFEEAKEDLLQMIYQYLEESNHPFAFLGHSMGSLLAYELALSVSEKGFIPSHLFLSGGQPPHSGWNHNSYYHSSDQLLKEHLLHLGGMPDIIMNNESLYHYFVHIIKEDYRIMDTYIVRKSYPMVPCEISVLCGDQDVCVKCDNSQWTGYSSKSLNVHTFEGNHFFLFRSDGKAKDFIKSRLSKIYI